MTREEFTQFRQHYGGPATTQSDPGLWPHAPLTQRELPLWFHRLKSYPLERLLQALNALSMRDRRNAPSVEQVVEALKTLAPPEVAIPAWQQQLAGERGLTVAELLAQARPAHGDTDIATCWREISDHGWHMRGREPQLLAAFASYASTYPQDRAFWHEQSAKVRRALAAEHAPPRRPVPDSRTFTHLGSLLTPQRRLRHA